MSKAPSNRPVVWLHSHFMLPTGGTKFVYEVARRLAEHRPLEMLVEKASPFWRERYAEAGIPLLEIGGATSTSLRYWGAFPAYLYRDRRVIRRRVAASSGVISSFFPMPWLAGRAARIADVAHVSLCFEPFPFFHDDEIIRLYSLPKQLLLRGLGRTYGWIDREGIRSVERLLTLNQATAKQIGRVYGRTDAVLTYAGVDTQHFHEYDDDQVRHLRQRIGEGPVVAHSTDYSPIKRTDLAIRAFAVASSLVPDARLAVTSTRDDPGALKELKALAVELGVEDKVDFLGLLTFEDVPRLYSLATVLLQTGTSAGSGATTMSLPVKEALACGTPAVRSGVTDEDVIDGVSGYLVDPSDSDQTGRRLAAILADPDLASRMGDAGQKRVVERYSWDRVVGVVLESLEKG